MEIGGRRPILTRGRERDGKDSRSQSRKEKYLLFRGPGSRAAGNHCQVASKCSPSTTHSPDTDSPPPNSPGLSEHRIRNFNILKGDRGGRWGGGEKKSGWGRKNLKENLSSLTKANPNRPGSFPKSLLAPYTLPLLTIYCPFALYPLWIASPYPFQLDFSKNVIL